MQYTLSNDNFEVIVDSKGCEIVSVIRKSDNKQYIWSGQPDEALRRKYCHIYQQEPPNVGVMSSIYHLTGSSWLIIFQLTGVQCQQN